MKAIFIGSDHSFNLRSGNTYEIEAQPSKCPLLILIDSRVSCPYSSLEAFLKNWKPLF